MRTSALLTAAVVATGASASLQHLELRQLSVIAGCETQCGSKMAWLQTCQADTTKCFQTCTDVTDLQPCADCAKEKKPDQAAQLDQIITVFKSQCNASGDGAAAGSASASGSGAAASGASAASSAASVAGSATSAAAAAASSATGGAVPAASYGPVGVAVTALVAGVAAVFML